MPEGLPGTCKVIRILGEGSGGTVFLALHRTLNKRVVLKRVKCEPDQLPRYREKTEQLKSLQHEHLAPLLDVVDMNGEDYAATDFVPGRSFRDYLEGDTWFEETDVITWAQELAGTLGYLHRQEPPVIHGNLKPSNLILKEDGHVCLIDLPAFSGLSDGEAFIPALSKGYASPEQLGQASGRARRKPIDHRTDIYSFGALIYHIYTGRRPVLRKGTAANPAEYRSNVNERFASVILKCLQEDASRRYQNAADLEYELLHLEEKPAGRGGLRRVFRKGPAAHRDRQEGGIR